MPGRDGDGLLGWQRGRDGRKGNAEIREPMRQMMSAKALQRVAAQELRPEHTTRELSKFLPGHSGPDSGTNNASGAGSGDDRRFDAGLGEELEDADVGQASHGATAKSQSDACGLKVMRTAQQIQLYSE